MSFNHVKEVIEIENTCLKEFRDEMAKMRDNAKDEFSREIFNDWVKYFDATIKLHKKAITNEARLRDGLKKENPALQRASDAIDSLGQLEKNPDIKDHYEWLKGLLQIEMDANTRIVGELDKLKKPTKEPSPASAT